MPLYEAGAVERNPGGVNRRCEGPQRIVEHLFAVWRTRAEGDRERDTLATAPGATDALQIVGKARRRIVHNHRRETTDIDAHLHGSRAAQDVQIPVLETLFELAQTLAVELSGMFGSLEVRGVGGYSIIQIRPHPQLACLPHLRICIQPFHDLMAVNIAPRRITPVSLGHTRRIEHLAPF